MNTRQIITRAIAGAATFLLISAGTQRLNGQTTAFSYQGQLNISNAPANGSFDFQFSVLSAGSGGTIIAGPLTNTATGVTNGVFMVQLDFGDSAFTGPPRWLQIGVRSNGTTGAFALLSPLQEVLATPYAITANSASNLLGAVAASQVTGSLPATQLSGTLTPAQLPSSAVVNSETGVTLSGTFSGNGSGLTGLNAANLTGAVPSASLTAVPAASLTGTISASQLPSTLLVNGQSGVSLTGSFSGNGSGLTGLSASQLGGTLSLAQLPGSVIVNGATSVTLSGSFNGFFSGNGSGLNSISAGTLTGTIPPGAIGAVPAANLTGTLPSGVLAGPYGNVLVLNNQGNTISGNGAGLTNLTATSLTGIIALANLPGNVFTIFTNLNTLSIVTNLTVVGTNTLDVLVVTNSALLTNADLVVTNTDGQEVVIDDGNISLTGTISGNASGLTNANGHSLADSSITNAVNLSLLTASNSVLLAASNSVYAASNIVETALLSAGTATTNITLGASNALETALLSAGTTGSNFTLTASNNVMLIGSNSVYVASNAVYGAANAFTLTASNNVSLSASNSVFVASNTVETALLSSGAGSTNFALGASNNVMLIGSNSVYVASNAVYGAANAFTLGASNNVMLTASNAVFVASNTVEAALLSTGQADTNFARLIGTTISNYAQSGNLILSNYVAAGGTLPQGASVSNAFLVGPSTNLGSFWVTNGNLIVSNGAVILPNAGGIGVSLNAGNTGNINFSGVATGDGANLTLVNAAMLESLTTNDFWLSGGNSGLTSGENTLGTIDNLSLILKTENQQALALVPDNTGNGLPILIGDGTANTVNVNAYGTSVGGGVGNGVGSGSYLSFVGGGNANTIGSAAFNSAIGGGSLNTIGNNAYESFVGGGLQNSIQAMSSNSFIGGGSLNTIQPSAGFTAIGGGYDNTVQQGAGYASISGGYLNTIFQNAGYSTIGGGQNNNINAAESVVGGGNANSISSTLSVVAGGSGNSIAASSDHSTIAGGQANNISGGATSFIGGGIGNSVTGAGGAVVGGLTNTATFNSFAAGTVAQAVNQGSFVWADSTGMGATSTNVNTVTFLANGGYRLYSGSAAGVFLASGDTAWATISDRNMKKNIAPIDSQSVLEKLAQVPVDSWNYKWETDDTTQHIGPMAQDFKHAFYPGKDDKSITTLEFDGVELAAIQGLNTKVDEQDATVRRQIQQQAEELKAKDTEIQSLKDRLERLEKLLNVNKN